MERPTDDWRDEEIAIQVPVRSVEAAIAALKAQSLSLHTQASLARYSEEVLALRILADAADAAAEDFRREYHTHARPPEKSN